MKKKLLAAIQTKLANLFNKLGISADTSFIDLQVPPDKANGDFSMNAAMKLAKVAKCAPRQLAEEIKSELETEKDLFEKIEVAGPGFINMRISDKLIENCFNEAANKESLIEKIPNSETTVIDYSSVNIAKQMHVGHLRSTIIGDVLSRVIEAIGNKVIRQNHLGDWGLPMGMVVYKAKPIVEEAEKSNAPLSEVLPLAKLEQLYKEATAESKEDPKIAEACHECVVKLQNGDPVLIDVWKKVVRVSMTEVYRIYSQLNVKLQEKDERGESFYSSMLADTVAAIKAAGALEESDGAQCVFLDEFKSKEGKPLPVIVQKSDGGYCYATFDLAALKFRTSELKADRIIYVTDARQALHFKQVFAAAKKTGILANPNVKLEHVTFGSILGEDNKPLKTRSGENVKLAELLNEAIEKAYIAVSEKNPNLTEEQKRRVSMMTGVGAIKYADLAQNRNNDYVFSFDRMLALNGNTAPYLQYAHARICSIFRKASLDADSFKASAVITKPEEKELMVKLMDFNQIVRNVASDLRPHLLCNYLYELSSAFSSFYDKCPVMSCEDEKNKAFKVSYLQLHEKNAICRLRSARHNCSERNVS